MDIKKQIKAKGWRMGELAKAMGISYVTLSQTLASGTNPRLSTLRRIADTIGCKVGDFFLDKITATEKEEKKEDVPIPCGMITIAGKEYDVVLTKRKKGKSNG